MFGLWSIFTYRLLPLFFVACVLESSCIVVLVERERCSPSSIVFLVKPDMWCTIFLLVRSWDSSGRLQPPPDRPGRLGEGMHFEKHTTQQMPGLLGRRIGPAGATKYCGVRYNRLMRIDRSDCFGPSHAKSAACAFGSTGRLGVWGHCWAISPFMLATSEASKSPSERLTWLKCRTCLFFLRGRGCSPPPERYKYLF